MRVHRAITKAQMAAVRRHRELLADATNAAVTDADELDFALRPDRQGIGVRAGVGAGGSHR